LDFLQLFPGTHPWGPSALVKSGKRPKITGLLNKKKSCRGPKLGGFGFRQLLLRAPMGP